MEGFDRPEWYQRRDLTFLISALFQIRNPIDITSENMDLFLKLYLSSYGGFAWIEMRRGMWHLREEKTFSTKIDDKQF